MTAAHESGFMEFSGKHFTEAVVWEGDHGRFSSYAVHMHLYKCPTIPGLDPFNQLIFTPRIGVMRVMRRGSWSDITTAERHLIELWLRRVGSGARQQLEPWDREERRQSERRRNPT